RHTRFSRDWSSDVCSSDLINLLGEMVSIGTLLAFVIVCTGILVLRYTRPDLERPFKAPLFPLTPILGILVCAFLMISLPWHTWERLLIWMALGLIIYFLYSRRHSKLGKLARFGEEGEDTP